MSHDPEANSILPPGYQADTSRRTLAGRLEDAVGSFFTAFVDCGVIGFFAMEAFIAQGSFHFDPLLMILGLLLALLINGRHLVWLWIGWSDRRHPAAIATALQQHVRLVILRPLLSAWWLASTLPPVLMALTSHSLQREVRNYAEATIFAVFAFGLLYAANGFLLLAVSAWTRNERTLQTVWRFRLLIDLGVTAIGILSPLLLAASRALTAPEHTGPP